MISKPQLNEKRQGFTLIELLIVVAIIGILAMIAVPRYNQYRRGAQDNVAQAAIRNLAMSLEAYLTANNEYATQYTLLQNAGLVKDQNVNYGKISLTVNPNNNLPGFIIEVQHKVQGSTHYIYDSSSSTTVSTTSTPLTSNQWS
jgi:prepilin-type N-terminal cleavage/methylation domain-containing protein